MQARSPEFKAERLDIQAFARAQAELQGSTPLVSMSRLAGSAHGADDPELPPPAGEVAWHAQGQWRERAGTPGEIWLHVTAHTLLPMTCQRCLQSADHALQVDRWFRFVASESEAAEQDADAEEDVLVLSRQFKLLELIEDELLLDLPVIPRHDECPVPPPLLDHPEAMPAAEEAAPNPFAVLESLKKPGRRGH